MTKQELFDLCWDRASLTVKSYRDEAPKNCDPVNWTVTTTLLVAATVVAIAGASVSAYAQYQQGQSQKKMADYNANVLQSQAMAARQAGQYEGDRIRERNRHILASQTANAMKSGVTNSGSVSDVMNDSAVTGEMDAMAAIYKGQIGADQANSHAALSRMQGASAQQQSLYGATGTLLSGAGQAAGYSAKNVYGVKNTQPTFDSDGNYSGVGVSEGSLRRGANQLNGGG